MASRAQLEYELAQIELDKRQLQLEDRKLQLERKELDVKQRLTQLNSIDLTEDEPLMKFEPRYGSTDHVLSTIRNSSPTEPSRDSTATTLTANNAKAVQEEMDLTQQAEPAIQVNNLPESTVDKPPALPTDNEPKQAQPAPQNALPSPASVSQLPETPTGADGQGLLAMFLGRPEESRPKSEAGSKRAHPKSDEEAGNSSKLSRRRSTTAAKIAAWNDSGVERNRVTRTAIEVKTQDTSGTIMTESEQHDLISHYTSALLRHMTAWELRLNPRLGNWNTIAAKVRHLNVGRIHPSITLLHREFSRIVAENRKIPTVRTNLEKELEKFENALPYWSPKCKTLPRQKRRLSLIDKVIEEIADDEFDNKDYKDFYDPYNEL